MTRAPAQAPYIDRSTDRQNDGVEDVALSGLSSHANSVEVAVVVSVGPGVRTLCEDKKQQEREAESAQPPALRSRQILPACTTAAKPYKYRHSLYCSLEPESMQMKESGMIEEQLGMDGEAHEKPETTYEAVRRLGSSNAVVVFSLSGCCMCHVMKQLLFGLGVGPTIVELDKEKYGSEMQSVLYQLAGGQHSVPAVFVGGKFLGGIETLMSCHINGTLVPLLKAAGALWL
ncbi:hypothetical protein VitviT2T_015465 [Vitis vinifera]|uniref:Glutaredoxin domain-containing protein n=2 Tax=Vitis vinifera TaxID=29760 RepID=A0ABY9CQ93_VITVI|nr:Glutaredoxin-C1 [Vitis vinifera]WJZ96818.1 hypothetical protein VitviT2T_015465 [Vitis vinifera]